MGCIGPASASTSISRESASGSIGPRTILRAAGRRLGWGGGSQAADVRLLLPAEPFEGLAPAVVEQLFETFDRLPKEIAIIIVDHHLDLALALSDTTVALERGQVLHRGPSRALRDDLDLRRKVLWL